MHDEFTIAKQQIKEFLATFPPIVVDNFVETANKYYSDILGETLMLKKELELTENKFSPDFNIKAHNYKRITLKLVRLVAAKLLIK